MKASEAIEAIRAFGKGEIEQFLDMLVPALGELLPLDGLLKLAAAIAQMVEAKTEEEQMKAAIKAVDAQVDAAEEEAGKADRWP